jgi:hypothetical protein
MSRRLQSSDERLRTVLRHFPSSSLTWKGVVNAKHPYVKTVKQRVTSTDVEAVPRVWAHTVQSAKFRQWILYHNVSVLRWLASEMNCTIWRACRDLNEARGWKGLGRAQSWLVWRQCPCSLYRRWVKPQKYRVQDRRCPGQHLFRGKMRPCNVKAHGIPSKMPAAP